MSAPSSRSLGRPTGRPVRLKLLCASGILVVSAVLCVAVPLAVLWSVQRSLLFPGASGMPMAWTGPALPADVVRGTVRTTDGEVLRALWRAPRPGAGVVVSFHGNGSLPEPAAWRFAHPPWSDDGWGFLAVAFRGYPGSTGRPSETGIVADGRAALAEARRRWPDARIVLHGHSLRTAVAVAVAAEAGNEVAAVYLEAPFSSVSAMASRRFFGLPFGPLVRDPLRSVDLMGKITAPVFIVHGSRDGAVPPAESELLAVAGHGVDRQVVDADHVSVLGMADATLEPHLARLTQR